MGDWFKGKEPFINEASSSLNSVEFLSLNTRIRPIFKLRLGQTSDNGNNAQTSFTTSCVQLVFSQAQYLTFILFACV